jgi:hypothetical protein
VGPRRSGRAPSRSVFKGRESLVAGNAGPPGGLKTLAVPAATCLRFTSRPIVSDLQHFGDNGTQFGPRASQIRQVEIALARTARPESWSIRPGG